MLNEEPMSANAAYPTVLHMTGMRYSKLPRRWVSPPIGVNEFDIWATFVPVTPVKTPTFPAAVGTPAMTSGVPDAFAATSTFFEVINVSIGASGLIERTL